MYEVITRYLKQIFQKKNTSDKLLRAEYFVIYKKLKNAKTLKLLVDTHKDISAYKNLVKQHNNPEWAVNNVTTLLQYWNKQYKLWKKRG